jgi:signal transduction histidine kinase
VRAHDAVLIDLAPAEGKGLEEVKSVRLAAPELPLLVFVPDGEDALGDAALQVGAHDYLSVADITPRAIERSLRHVFERVALERLLQGERADLAASRASMVGLIEGNADGLVVIDRSGVTRFANPAAALLFGLPESEIVGEPLGVPLTTEGASEIELLAGDGRPRVAEVRVAPVSWDGAPAYLASLRDVTDRKRVERTMQRSAESFRTLAEAAPDAIVVHRGDAMVWANRAFARLLGVEAHEAAQVRSVASWLSTEGRTDLEDPGADLSSGPFPAMVRRRESTAIPVEVRQYRVLFDGAEATLSLVQDLAAREQRARARAQHERLASLGRLAANLGHEINNPLSYVVSNLSYLGSLLADLGARSDSDPDLVAASADLQEACSAAHDALEGAERVAAIVRDVRVLSRIESRELRPLRVPDVLQSAMRIVRGKLAEVAQVSLALDDVPAVHGNDTALLQVFVNLLVNAADACAERVADPHRVNVACFSDAEGRVVIEIRDTGPGISDEIRGHLFEPFFTTKAAGSGFGLAISYAIVESLSGKLTLESDTPHGAIARVVLPPAPRAGLGIRSRRGSSPRPSRPSGRGDRDRAARAGSARGSAARAEPS